MNSCEVTLRVIAWEVSTLATFVQWDLMMLLGLKVMVLEGLRFDYKYGRGIPWSTHWLRIEYLL